MSQKFATVIGINYIGTVNELNGCIKDSKDIKSFLETNLSFQQINYLTDNEQLKPTDANIKSSIIQMISNAKNALQTVDQVDLFFYYSGHGASIPDRSGDETDRKDETICPLDGGLIVDDDLLKLLILPLRDLALTNQTKTIKLVTMFDSCHSGSILDLNQVFDIASNQWKSFTRKPISPIASNFHLVSLSGCQDGEYSTDLGIQGGALTQTVLKILQQKPLSTWRSLIHDVVKALKSYKQKPLLTSLTPIDLDYAFFDVHNQSSESKSAGSAESAESAGSAEKTNVIQMTPIVDTIPETTQPVEHLQRDVSSTAEMSQPSVVVASETPEFSVSTNTSTLTFPPVSQTTSAFTLTHTDNSSSKKTTSSLFKFKFDQSTKFDSFSHVIKSADMTSELKLSVNQKGWLKIKHSKLIKN